MIWKTKLAIILFVVGIIGLLPGMAYRNLYVITLSAIVASVGYVIRMRT